MYRIIKTHTFSFINDNTCKYTSRLLRSKIILLDITGFFLIIVSNLKEYRNTVSFQAERTNKTIMEFLYKEPFENIIIGFLSVEPCCIRHPNKLKT